MASLASVYHRPASSFVEGKHALAARRVQSMASKGLGGLASSSAPATSTDGQTAQPTVIPSQDKLIDDLLDLGPSSNFDMMASGNAQVMAASGSVAHGGGTSNFDLLGDGLDGILMGVPADTGPKPVQPAAQTTAYAAGGGSNDILGMLDTLVLGGAAGGASFGQSSYVAPKQIWLESSKGKGLEIQGCFVRKSGSQMCMELILANKAMQAMTDFAIQFNKNSFGICPAQPMNISHPLAAQQTIPYSLALQTGGPLMKMNPLCNLQVALKNNVDVHYFQVEMPMYLFFVEDGEMEKRVFLATWKDIPAQNEMQFTLDNINMSADQVSQQLKLNNVFTIAKRTVDGQDMLYQTVKLSNDVWVLAELKIQPGNPTITLSLKSRVVDVYPGIHQSYKVLLEK